MTTPDYARRHLRIGWWSLLCFATVGLVLEMLHGFKVRAYLDKQKLDVPVLMDMAGTVGAMYRASAIPLTVVVGRDGKVVRILVGLHDEEDLRDVLREAGID